MISNYFIVGAILVGVFVLVSILLRYSSGWSKIENLYLNSQRPQKKFFGLHTIAIASPIDPRGVFHGFYWMMKIGSSPSGVYFASVFPFFPSLRPVTLPWDDVVIQKLSKSGLNKYEVVLKRIPGVKIIIERKVAEELLSNQADSLKRHGQISLR